MACDLSIPILVVDDTPSMRSVMRNLLTNLGFMDVHDACDGSDALAKMRKVKFGLIISDWKMKPMTGYELLRDVRADPGLADTPFIMVTSESEVRKVIAAKRAGVSSYINIPFNSQTLKAKIEEVLGSVAEDEFKI
jgi:two-component system chemotaxis response regulator CheY